MGFPLSYDIVAPQMRSLQKLEAALQRLDLRWEVIDTTARIVCPGEAAGFLHTLDQTRTAFATLAQEMVEHIATTHLSNRLGDLASRAQVAIDILVRNLFERTADVGFIATDGPLVAFVEAAGDNGDPDTATLLRRRLQEYRAKYTVYDDILLLDAYAHPLLGLEDRQMSEALVAQEPAWWRSAMDRPGYGEHYGASAWYPGEGDLLLYVHRVASAQGRACGAVVLRFGLHSELESIFADLRDPEDRVALLLVDGSDRVIASSKPAEFSVGEFLATGSLQSLDARPCTHRGHDYLAQARTTRGYQGYQGLPWRAVALVRLDAAFKGEQGTPDSAAGAAQHIGAGAGGAQAPVETAGMEVDDPMLRAIVERARAIEEGLTRVIWNGKVAESAVSAGSSIHAVFDQIGRTGKDTIAVFDGAIQELRGLLLAGRRAEMKAHAGLAVRIMDRNLYERANDCRWWALSEELAHALTDIQARGAPEQSAAAAQRAAQILAHLNSLYTVYRRVALFDRQGRVVAVSCDANTLPADLQLDADLVRRTLALQGAQAYAVSPMLPQALADGLPAYVYCAALRTAPGGPVVGGIALAFNCATELKAMLRDALPQGQAVRGFFTDAQGRVLASADEDGPDAAEGCVPPVLPFVADMARAAVLTGAAGRQPGPAGKTPSVATASAMPATAQRVRWQGQDYLAGVAASTGYREFKRDDGYREPVYSVLLMPVQPAVASSSALALPQSSVNGAGGNVRRYGVVACGALLLAIDSVHVQQAMSAARLVQVPGPAQLAGMLEIAHEGGTRMAPAYDACRIAGLSALADPRRAVAVVVTSQGRPVVLLVERLVGVVSQDSVHPVPGSVSAHAPWITGILSDRGSGQAIVYVVDPNGLDARWAPLPPEVLAAPSASGTAAELPMQR
ncbi:chemotaxis protein CheW [Acidovorax sp. ACV01]|uniref:chemotaxis protein CheW n=1 Tax=Acidovorax sp. ACV01 TaxID=2769311 RepID=UPI00178262B3|nr:chemotaxis protein CheW [Acidovorax sp. ACV01]MBD9393022.1 chemotaxis protein CheW [Acidovorax sp. ACV01]